MKKILKRKLFWFFIIVIALISAGGFWLFQNAKNSQKIVYTTEPAQIGNLKQTVTATGAVESAQDISLSFKAGGRLVEIKAKEGDKVKQGDILARLDASSLSAQVQQYQANVSAAKADLSRIRAGASPEDVNVSLAQLNKAKDDLQNLISESQTQIPAYRQSDLNALNSAQFTAQVALDKIYNYFFNTNVVTGLQVVDSGLQNSVRDSYTSLSQKFKDNKILIDKANADKTDASIGSAATDVLSDLGSMNNFLSLAFNLGEAIIINSDYPQTTKNAIKADIGTQQTANSTAITALQTANSALTNGIKGYNDQISAASNSVSIYQSQLNLKQSGPRSFELEAAQARVSQAQAQLDMSVVGLNDYVITAPVDGIVTKVNGNVGEQNSMTAPVVKMISNGKFEIKVDIAESDIAKVKIGDVVSIQLDAFGSDHVFAGAVTAIDTAQTVIQDVTYYKTTVGFGDDPWNEKLKSGMSADVTINTANKDNVLYIPQKAVKIRQANLDSAPEKYVQVLLSDGTVSDKTVQIGLRADDAKVEVTSGLSAGDLVITFKK
ncbi:MAG: efflux RND transporter periplasmic adaptor subunit [bacterium]